MPKTSKHRWMFGGRGVRVVGRSLFFIGPLDFNDDDSSTPSTQGPLHH